MRAAIDTDPVDAALATLDAEQRGLASLRAALGADMAEPFRSAVASIRNASGRVIVTGVGKSGHVGRKIAATLASTGTPASFVHAGEAGHGDLGMITGQDAIIALSWSGETAELAALIAYSKRFSIPLIALTSEPGSSLAKAATSALILPKAEEACPNGLAPTTSTTMQLVLGDALAVALLKSRGFSATDFRVFHPGGKLGAALRMVRDVMHTDDELPLVFGDASITDAIYVMTAKRFGCVLVTDRAGRLEGILTDGDLRRAIERVALDGRVADVMTRGPQVALPDMLVAEALAIMEARRITALPVVQDGYAVGILHLHDLLRLGAK
jgi:arabinose-5-phosphate isomerase